MDYLTLKQFSVMERQNQAFCQIPFTKFEHELSRLTHIEKAVKNTTIFVIYKVLVYIQMSQPTTCFGLF